MFLFEQAPLNIPQPQAQNDQQQIQQIQQEEPVEYTPLKKYFLAQKLNDLNIRLKKYNMTNETLDIMIKFMDSLSYETLVTLSNNIIQTINAELERAIKDAK